MTALAVSSSNHPPAASQTIPIQAFQRAKPSVFLPSHLLFPLNISLPEWGKRVCLGFNKTSTGFSRDLSPIEKRGEWEKELKRLRDEH